MDVVTVARCVTHAIKDNVMSCRVHNSYSVRVRGQRNKEEEAQRWVKPRVAPPFKLIHHSL